jgi:hypothetical protein
MIGLFVHIVISISPSWMVMEYGKNKEPVLNDIAQSKIWSQIQPGRYKDQSVTRCNIPGLLVLRLDLQPLEETRQSVCGSPLITIWSNLPAATIQTLTLVSCHKFTCLKMSHHFTGQFEEAPHDILFNPSSSALAVAERFGISVLTYSPCTYAGETETFTSFLVLLIMQSGLHCNFRL